jgi:adenylate cyclase
MQRKLTVIFSADVVGYSSLMERDEGGTLARLKENRKALFDPCVAAHGGRVFKLMGDGVLIEFPSAASAVTCALEIQRAMETGEAHKSEAERLRYRIGINLGDVIIEGDDIYGEGVNVAARLQALAPVGGIAVSRNVSDQVTGKVAAEFEDLGAHTVKNIERPVHVFGVRPKLAGGATRASTQPEKQPGVSICVLPFTNMSGDSEQEYFSDGISEDIITDLSKVSALSIIARNTAFTFKGKHVDVSSVARQLKVSHVLEGSVRKSGSRVRITAQLIDGATGAHLWAERYDRDLNDIFALQDEISEAIVAALRLRLLPEEKKAIERRGTSDPEAYKLYLMARKYTVTRNIGDARGGETIIRLCRRAIEIDPNYARAWALMANTQGSMQLHHGWQGDNGEAAAARALSLDDRLSEAHTATARVLFLKGKLDEALREIEIALQLDPDSYEANQTAGRIRYGSHRVAEAIPYYEKAAALAESDYLAAGLLISCYVAVGDTEGARRAARRTLMRCEMSYLVTALAALGEADRAKEWVERALLIDPNNENMRYNFACAFIISLNDHDTALDLLEFSFQRSGVESMDWARTDPDLDAIRDHPRFKAMLAAAEARLAADQSKRGN